MAQVQGRENLTFPSHLGRLFFFPIPTKFSIYFCGDHGKDSDHYSLKIVILKFSFFNIIVNNIFKYIYIKQN